MIKGGMRKWIEKQLGKGTKLEDKVAGANIDEIWWEIVKATGRTAALGKDVDAEGVEGEVGQSQVTWSLRVGELRSAVHGRQSRVWASTDPKGAWAWCRKQGCVMGCTERSERGQAYAPAAPAHATTPPPAPSQPPPNLPPSQPQEEIEYVTVYETIEHVVSGQCLAL